MRVIGRKLNVRYLLEGSVQAAGNKLRVTSRLVDAQTGASVWSKQFNPELQDLFAVQDEIALEVARALQLTLDAANNPATGARASATKNYDAYFEFLRGRALLASVRVTDLPAAIDALSAAIRHDPKFASPYVLLARAKILKAEQDEAGKQTEKFPEDGCKRDGLAQQGARTGPQSGEAYVERGYLKIYFDVAAADADLRRGLELAPNYARGYEGLAAVTVPECRPASRSARNDREGAQARSAGASPRRAQGHLPGMGFWRLAAGGPKLRKPCSNATRCSCRPWCASPKSAGADRPARRIRGTRRAGGLTRSWKRDRLATLSLSYISVGEIAAAEAAIGPTSDHPALGPMNMHLFRNEWRRQASRPTRWWRRPGLRIPDRSPHRARNTPACATDR